MWAQRQYEVITKLEEYVEHTKKASRLIAIPILGEENKFVYETQENLEDYHRMLEEGQKKLNEEREREARRQRELAEKQKVQEKEQHMIKLREQEFFKISEAFAHASANDKSLSLDEPADWCPLNLDSIPDFRKNCHFYEGDAVTSTFGSSTGLESNILSTSETFPYGKQHSSLSEDQILQCPEDFRVQTIDGSHPFFSQKHISILKLEEDLYESAPNFGDDDDVSLQIRLQQAVESGTLSRVQEPEIEVMFETTPPNEKAVERPCLFSLSLASSILHNPQPDVTVYIYNFKQESMMHNINGISIKAADNVYLHSHAGGVFTYDTRKGGEHAKMFKYFDTVKPSGKTVVKTTQFALKNPDFTANEEMLTAELPETAPFPSNSIDFLHVDPEKQFILVVKDDRWHKFRTNKSEHGFVEVDGRTPPLGRLSPDI